MKFLRDTLDVIQSIDTNDEFNAVEPLLELVNPLLNGLFGEVLCAAGRPSGAIASWERDQFHGSRKFFCMRADLGKR